MGSASFEKLWAGINGPLAPYCKETVLALYEYTVHHKYQAIVQAKREARHSALIEAGNYLHKVGEFRRSRELYEMAEKEI